MRIKFNRTNRDIEDMPELGYDFWFECPSRYLMSECNEQARMIDLNVRRLKFLSTSGHVRFCL